MANLFESIEKFDKILRTSDPAGTIQSSVPGVTLVYPDMNDPMVRFNEEYNFATAKRQDPEGSVRQTISELAMATFGFLPNKLERFQGRVPNDAIDGPLPLTDRTWYYLFRLVGNDAEEVAALVEKNASVIGDRHSLYWILVENYHYSLNDMLRAMRAGELKPLKKL